MLMNSMNKLVTHFLIVIRIRIDIQRPQVDRHRNQRASQRPVAAVGEQRQSNQMLGGRHWPLHEHLAVRGEVHRLQLATSVHHDGFCGRHVRYLDVQLVLYCSKAYNSYC